jgi:hypothetical protein
VLTDGDHCERSGAIPGRDAYVEAHALVADRWQNSRAWWRSGVLNTARMGWFSSDRAGAAGAWPPVSDQATHVRKPAEPGPAHPAMCCPRWPARIQPTRADPPECAQPWRAKGLPERVTQHTRVRAASGRATRQTEECAGGISSSGHSGACAEIA